MARGCIDLKEGVLFRKDGMPLPDFRLTPDGPGLSPHGEGFRHIFMFSVLISFFLSCPGAEKRTFREKSMRPEAFKDPFNGRTGVFHLSSDHLTTLRLFTTKEDFNYGVNTLALGAARFSVSILCYELMDSHLHSMVRGVWEECRAFFRWALHRLSLMISQRDGVSGVLPRDGFDVHAITDTRQFRNETAYILRNCYKARMCSPFSYPWSSIDVLFNPFRNAVTGKRVSGMGVVEIRKLFRTRASVPEHYEVFDGRVMNRCFVDYPFVEKQLGDSLTFFDAIRVWDLESSVELSHGASEKVTFTDSELSVRITTICRKEYHTDSVQQLDRKSLLSLARSAARRFGAGKSQLARIMNLSPEILEKVL